MAWARNPSVNPSFSLIPLWIYKPYSFGPSISVSRSFVNGFWNINSWGSIGRGVQKWRPKTLTKDLDTLYMYESIVRVHTPRYKLQWRTPYEVLTGQKSDISDLQVFGSLCWAFVVLKIEKIHVLVQGH
jgi:hypothetical protein